MQASSSTSVRSAILLVALLQGCDWVDSTGQQANDIPLDGGVFVPIVEFESAVIPLPENQASVIFEATANRTRLEGSNSAVKNWQWELTNDHDVNACGDLVDYDTSLAVDSLNDACTVQDKCDIEIKEMPGIEAAEFVISLPPLKTPVALHYRLTAELNDGAIVERSQTLCGLSINESPAAADDSYMAMAGKPFVVLATDANGLLANDIDDEDARNLPLRVDTQAVQLPQFADQFQLQADGGFFYRAAADTPLDENGRQTDTFVYAITDGSHTSQATATITIIAGNEAPLAIGNLPDVEIDLQRATNQPAYELDVSPYFTDVDGDPLNFSIERNDLPGQVLPVINNQGLLRFYVNTNQPLENAGPWQLDVTASDGLLTARSGLLLSIVNAQTDNSPPTVTDIANRSFKGEFDYDVSVFFNDPDGDALTFSANRLPPAMQLSSSGVLSGVGSWRNAGRWFISVTATDPWGNSVSDGFALQISE